MKLEGSSKKLMIFGMIWIVLSTINLGIGVFFKPSQLFVLSGFTGLMGGLVLVLSANVEMHLQHIEKIIGGPNES